MYKLTPFDNWQILEILSDLCFCMSHLGKHRLLRANEHTIVRELYYGIQLFVFRLTGTGSLI